MGWRSNRIPSVSVDSKGNPSMYCGVNMSGNAIQMISVDESLRQKFRLPYFKGTMVSRYVFGDIRYPFQPQMTTGNIRFDIVTDSNKWTDVGPTVSKYEGGDSENDGVEYIFSWEGRTNTHAKKISRTAAGLPDLGD
jgi:hypothetical protein